MSVELIDSFEHYVSADLFNGKWSGGINVNPTISTTLARTGTKSLSFSASANCGIYKLFSGNRATIIVGGAWNTANVTSSLFPVYLFSDGANTSVQVMIGVTATQKIVAYRGSASGTLLGTSTLSVPPSLNWMHIAAKVTFHPSAGTVEVRVNDVVFLNLTGINTITTANSYADRLVMGYNGSTQFLPQTYLDDFFLFNSLGSTCNDFPGDASVTCLTINGNGTTQNFTRSSGSNNYQMVNEAAQDGDSTYISSSTAGDIETDAHTTLSNAGTIYTAQLVSTARKDDAGSRHLGLEIRTGGANHAGVVDVSLTNSYQMVIENFEVDPATSVAWTQTNINSSEIGVKVIS